MAIEGDPRYIIEEPPEAASKYGLAAGAICVRLINFTTGDHTLLAPHKDGLKRNVLDKVSRDAAMYIVGHASRVGGDTLNQKLSERRANEVLAYFKERAHLPSDRLKVFGTGETEALGATDNDPRDRAVVIVLQAASAPIPKVLPPLPPMPPPKPEPPHVEPPHVVPPSGFGFAGWKVESVSNLGGAVPVGGVISVGASWHTIQLKNLHTNQIATYEALLGLVSAGAPKIPGGNSVSRFLTRVLQELGKRVKFAPNFGPSALPTFGSEILVTPWVNRPVKAPEFACPIFICQAGAAFGASVGGSLIVWSKIQFGFSPIEQALWLGSIKGFAVYAGFGLSLPSASIDALFGRAMLSSVVPP